MVSWTTESEESTISQYLDNPLSRMVWHHSEDLPWIHSMTWWTTMRLLLGSLQSSWKRRNWLPIPFFLGNYGISIQAWDACERRRLEVARNNEKKTCRPIRTPNEGWRDEEAYRIERKSDNPAVLKNRATLSSSPPRYKLFFYHSVENPCDSYNLTSVNSKIFFLDRGKIHKSRDFEPDVSKRIKWDTTATITSDCLCTVYCADGPFWGVPPRRSSKSPLVVFGHCRNDHRHYTAVIDHWRPHATPSVQHNGMWDASFPAIILYFTSIHHLYLHKRPITLDVWR